MIQNHHADQAHQLIPCPSSSFFFVLLMAMLICSPPCKQNPFLTYPMAQMASTNMICSLCAHVFAFLCVYAHVLKQLSDERVLLMGAHASRLLYFIQLMGACLDDGASHGYLS